MNRRGVTLVELILSIAILGIIGVSFMPIFVMSTKVNSISEEVLDNTYIGKDVMELIYSLSTQVRYEELGIELISMGYNRGKKEEEYVYEDMDRGKTIRMSTSREGGLVRVKLKVYEDDIEDYDVMYETLYRWVD